MVLTLVTASHVAIASCYHVFREGWENLLENPIFQTLRLGLSLTQKKKKDPTTQRKKGQHSWKEGMADEYCVMGYVLGEGIRVQHTSTASE